MELTVRSFHRGANIKTLSPTNLARGQVERAGNVSDIHVITSISAITKDLGVFSIKQTLGKNCHYSGFTMRILAGTVHVGRRNVSAFQAIKMTEGIQINLAGHLGCCIR